MNARGIDVSHHQDPDRINWTAVAAEHSFVIARATYGDRPDERFAGHIDGGLAAGMRVGGYHFFRQTKPVDEQITAFLNVLDASGCGVGWLPPAIDVERNQWDGQADPGKYRAGVRQMIDACLERYGSVIVYANRSDLATLCELSWFDDPSVMLWIANYGVSAPRVPDGVPWTFWQTTGSGRIAGYGGNIDLNQFAGSAESLPVISSDTEPVTAPDTERPPAMTLDESHAIQISKLNDIAIKLANGLLDLSGKLDMVLTAVGSTNATLWDHERRLVKIEGDGNHKSGNGATPAE